jgi:RNA polymerase sigma-70 factor (ECF subfamily)
MPHPSEFSNEDRLAAECIRGMAAGRAEDLDKLYDLYHRPLLHFLNGILRQQESAEEILQDVFVRIYREADQYDPELGKPFSYLLTIGKRMAIDRLRARRRRRQILAGEVEQAERIADISSHGYPEKDVRLEILWMQRYFDLLSPTQREAIELAFFSGYTHHEIAETLDRPLGTVKSDVRRGLRKLREAYLGNND